MAPDAVSFQGRKWLPAEHDVNVVWIGKVPFYIKEIVFGGLPAGADSFQRVSGAAREPN